MALWKVSHNNEPEKIVEADTRQKAIEAAGVPKNTPHPFRVWPAEHGETKESLAAKLQPVKGA